MKKTLAILITLLTIMSLTTLVAAAEYDATQPTTVQVSSVSGQIGKTVDIAILLSNNPGVSSFSFNIFFDESKLTLTNIAFNTTLGGQTGSSESMNSPVTIQWVNAFDNWSQDGAFATLTFQISDEAVNNTDTEISISYDPDNIYNLLEENVEISVTNGKVSIIPLAGDINGDGKVNNKDVTRLFQNLANWNVAVNQEVLDVNGDGKTNNKDITRLMQYLANWDVKIYYQTVHTHTYGEWTSSGDSTHERICSCGDKQLEAHIWDAGTVIKNATHTEYGEIRYTCSVCHETKTEQIEKIATHTFGNWTYMNESLHKRICACGSEETDVHSWDEGVVIKEATAIQEGSKKYTCTVCGGTKTEAISTTSYTVKFYSGDELLDVQAIKHGMSATAPVDPEKDEYRFTGWDKVFTNITQDMDIHAVFIKTYVVDFIDYNYSVISSQTVDVGGNAMPPQSPTRINYKFSGWDGNYKNINADTTVKATYVRTYTVTFADFDGTVLNKQTITAGESAAAPMSPVRTGYKFIGWDRTYDNVSSSITVKAQYTLNVYSVTFVDVNGQIVSTQSIVHGYSAQEPGIDSIYFDWKLMKGYSFSGWDKNFDQVTQDLYISPLYTNPINDLIMIVDTESSQNLKKGTTSTTVRVYLCGDYSIYGLDMSLKYDEHISLTGEKIKLSNQLTQTETKLNDFNKTYDLTWSSGTPVKINGNFELVSLTFEIPARIDAGYYIVSILENTYFINEKLEKTHSVIVSGTITIIE